MNMRKIILLSFSLLMALTVYADRVSPSDAALVADHFMSRLAPAGTRPAAPGGKMILRLPAQTDENRFYVYENPDGEGWVMVAADDAARPVLAYSLTGAYRSDNQPDNIKSWLAGYNRAIAIAEQEGRTATEETAALWQALRDGRRPAPAGTEAVNPLVKTHWDQDEPYNDLCPYNEEYKERAVTGCVATAMAQIMAYWQYPSKGTGYHSYTHPEYGRLSANFASTGYDWDNMLKSYYYGGTSTQKEAVATLMYHCGVSTEMQYGVSDEGGSGTYVLKEYCNTGTDNAEYALETYFGYTVEKSGIRGRTVSRKEWTALLKNDLDNARPVLYAGNGDGGGHCFVCDGYDSEGYFHFNWGWGGYADGYFLLDALEPEEGGEGGGDYTYNDNQKALFGLRPAAVLQEDGQDDIRLYSKISAPDSVRFFKDFESSVKIANFNKTKDTECTIAAVLFDSDRSFYDYIDSLPGTIEAYTYFTYKTTYPGKAAFMPGDYYLAYFYHTDDGGWTLIDNDTVQSVKPFRVWYHDGIEMYSGFNTVSGEFREDSDVELEVSIANVSGEAFKGDLRINLAGLEDGKWAQNFELVENVEINNNKYRRFTFKGHITVEPGTYCMEAAYRREGDSQWYYVGSRYQPNPVRTVVRAKEVLPDRYEDNDELMDAYVLHPVFDEAGTCTFDIQDATLHIGSDVDYFALVLPEDGWYTVTPQSFDASMNKGYTVTTSSYYYISQSKEATPFDSNALPFKAQGGAIVYFRTVPLLSGGKGSYGLKIKVQRGEAKGEAITVRYFPPESWDAVYLWAWTEDGDIFAKWPGVALRKGQDGCYSYTFEEGERGINVIFSNSDGVQTMDLDEVINESVCLTFDGADRPARVIDCQEDGGATPLPAAEQDRLRIAGDAVRCRGSIRIYTVSGELVLTATDEAPLTGLPGGIYIIFTDGQAVKYIR